MRDKRYINDCWQWVEYQLTWTERLQIPKAYIFKFFAGGCLADYESAELEELLCGYDPLRHRITGKVDD